MAVEQISGSSKLIHPKDDNVTSPSDKLNTFKLTSCLEKIKNHKYVQKLSHNLQILLEFNVKNNKETRLIEKLTYLKSLTNDSSSANIFVESSTLLEVITDLLQLLTVHKEARDAFDQLDGYSIVMIALHEQYNQHRNKNDNSEALSFCSKAIDILTQTLARNEQVGKLLIEDSSLIELITEMLERQENDQLIASICIFFCNSFFLTTFSTCKTEPNDKSFLQESKTLEALINLGTKMKEDKNDHILELVLRALDFYITDEYHRAHLQTIDNFIGFITSLLTYTSREPKWWERKPKLRHFIHDYVYNSDRSIFKSCFYMFCPSLLMKLCDHFWNSFEPKVVGSSNNLAIVADYLRGVLPAATRDGFMEIMAKGFIISNVDIHQLALKYHPTKFSPNILLLDPSIKFLVCQVSSQPFTYMEKLQQGSNFYLNYQLFSPYIEPPSSLSTAIVRHASRIVMYCSIDQPMDHFRQNKTFDLLMNRHVDYLELPLEMPLEDRLFVHENSCRAVTKILERSSHDPEITPEWKQLLALNSKQPFFEKISIKFRKTDDKNTIFGKLLKLKPQENDLCSLGSLAFTVACYSVFAILFVFGIFCAFGPKEESPEYGSDVIVQFCNQWTAKAAFCGTVGSIRRSITNFLFEHPNYFMLIFIFSIVAFEGLPILHLKLSKSNYRNRQFSQRFKFYRT